MKKVLFIIIAIAIGIGIVMLMQSNKMPANGQSSAVAPITNDVMTPAPAVPAKPAPGSMMENKPADTAAPAAAPTSDATIPPCPSTPDNGTPGTMMVDGKQVPCMPSDNMQNMQDNAAMHHSMSTDTPAAPVTATDAGNAGSTSSESTGDQNGASNIEQKMDSTMNGTAGNPGAPVNNVNESTK